MMVIFFQFLYKASFLIHVSVQGVKVNYAYGCNTGSCCMLVVQCCHNDWRVVRQLFIMSVSCTRSVNKVMRLPAYRTIWQYCGLALHMKVR